MSPIPPCMRDTELSVPTRGSRGIHMKRSRLLGMFVYGNSHFTWRTNGRLWYPLVSFGVLFSPAAILSQGAIALNNYSYYTSFTLYLHRKQEHSKLESWSTRRCHPISSQWHGIQRPGGLQFRKKIHFWGWMESLPFWHFRNKEITGQSGRASLHA